MRGWKGCGKTQGFHHSHKQPRKRTPGSPKTKDAKDGEVDARLGSLTADLVSVPRGQPAWTKQTLFIGRLVPQWSKSRRGLAGLFVPFPSLRGQPAS